MYCDDKTQYYGKKKPRAHTSPLPGPLLLLVLLLVLLVVRHGHVRVRLLSAPVLVVPAESVVPTSVPVQVGLVA